MSRAIGRARKKVRTKKWNCSKRRCSAIRILLWPIAFSRKRRSTCLPRRRSEDRKHFELGKKAAEAALRVRPDLGEAHLELARYYYYAAIFTDRNGYDRARDELTIARRTLPNNSEAIMIAARIDKRQNRWDSSLAGFQKATELDPRDGEADGAAGRPIFRCAATKSGNNS